MNRPHQTQSARPSGRVGAIDEGCLLSPIFLDFTSQIGWDHRVGVTKPGALKPETDYPQALVCASNVKNVCVLVVEERSFDDEQGIKLLKLSDTQYSIYALIWNYTQGFDPRIPLKERVIQLHNFDVSARYAPVDREVDDQRELQQQLQYHIVINHLSVHQPEVPPSQHPLQVRDKANVQAFLGQFKKWYTYVHQANKQILQNTTMEGITTQLPLATQPPPDLDTQATSVDHSQSQSQSNDSLRNSSKDLPKTIDAQAGNIAQKPKKTRRFDHVYDGDAAWAKLTSGPLRSQDIRVPKTQRENMQWAPAPGTKNVPPAVDPADLELMMEYADNADDYVDLVNGSESSDDETVSKDPAEGGKTREDDGGTAKEEELSLAAVAMQMRERKHLHDDDGDDDEAVPASQWPASEPVEPEPLEDDMSQSVIASQLLNHNESSDEEQADDPTKLPEDSDTEQPQRRPAKKSPVKKAPVYSMSSESESNSDFSPGEEEFPKDKSELEKQFDEERNNSPRKAALFRALRDLRANQFRGAAASQKSISSLSIQTCIDDHRMPKTQLDGGRTIQQTETQPRPQDQTTRNTAELQVGRSPYTEKKRISRPPSATQPPTTQASMVRASPVASIRSGPRSSMRSISPIKPPTSNVVESSDESSTKLPPQNATSDSQPKRRSSISQVTSAKKPRFSKPVVKNDFELSQDLLDHAGSQYSADRLRGEHLLRPVTPVTSTNPGGAGQDEDDAMDIQEEATNIRDGQQQADFMDVDESHGVDTLETEWEVMPRARYSAEMGPPPLPALDASQPSRASRQSSVVSHQGTLNDSQIELFDRFMAAYPTWPGTLKDFRDGCRALQSAPVTKTFYDDFVIRRKVDYRLYADQRLDNNEDHVSYFEWFDEISDSPVHKAKILSKDTIAAFLARQRHPPDPKSYLSTAIGTSHRSPAALGTPTPFDLRIHQMQQTPTRLVSSSDQRVQMRSASGSEQPFTTRSGPFRSQQSISRPAMQTPSRTLPSSSVSSSAKRGPGTKSSTNPGDLSIRKRDEQVRQNHGTPGSADKRRSLPWQPGSSVGQSPKNAIEIDDDDSEGEDYPDRRVAARTLAGVTGLQRSKSTSAAPGSSKRPSTTAQVNEPRRIASSAVQIGAKPRHDAKPRKSSSRFRDENAPAPTIPFGAKFQKARKSETTGR